LAGPACISCRPCRRLAALLPFFSGRAWRSISAATHYYYSLSLSGRGTGGLAFMMFKDGGSAAVVWRFVSCGTAAVYAVRELLLLAWRRRLPRSFNTTAGRLPRGGCRLPAVSTLATWTAEQRCWLAPLPSGSRGTDVTGVWFVKRGAGLLLLERRGRNWTGGSISGEPHYFTTPCLSLPPAFSLLNAAQYAHHRA